MSPASIAYNFALNGQTLPVEIGHVQIFNPQHLCRGTLMMVDDGTPGVNEAYAFQHPLAQVL